MKKGSLTAAFCWQERNLGSGALAVLLPEAFNTASGVDNLLLAGIKRVTGRTNFNVKRLAIGGAGRENIATATGDVDFDVVRVNSFFHFVSSFSARPVTLASRRNK
jgi:hypothetical protein